jgi:uncharacterized protein YciI
MQKYIIYAKDGTDDGALARRFATRAAHFEGTAALKAAGNYIEGGALVNDENKMIGSVLILQFEQKADLQAWLDIEPYIKQGVWGNIEIHKYSMPPPQ